MVRPTIQTRLQCNITVGKQKKHMLEDKYYFPWAVFFYLEETTQILICPQSFKKKPTKETGTSRIISTILFSISI